MRRQMEQWQYPASKTVRTRYRIAPQKQPPSSVPVMRCGAEVRLMKGLGDGLRTGMPMMMTLVPPTTCCHSSSPQRAVVRGCEGRVVAALADVVQHGARDDLLSVALAVVSHHLAKAGQVAQPRAQTATDMSGGPKGANGPLERPLDGGLGHSSRTVSTTLPILSQKCCFGARKGRTQGS